MQLLKSTYFALEEDAIVRSLSLPSTLRNSFTSRVKFLVSSGDDEMPALLLVGYSQSRSKPSRLHVFTAFRHF